MVVAIVVVVMVLRMEVVEVVVVVARCNWGGVTWKWWEMLGNGGK